MMDLISNTIRQQKILIVSIGMCVALWSGIIGEYSHISGIANPTLSYGFLKSIASVMPFIVATMAVVLIIYRIEDGTRIKVLLLGPLGFATIYGFVGIISALNSPDTSIAIYWAASYISVPIVLWAVALMGVTANQLRLIISFIKAVFGVAVVVLLAFGLIKLNFWNLLTSPTDWLKCAPQSWYVESSHLIRETGVGRYAAVAAIFSISALWQRSWRFFWVALFLISIFLLITSGARTSLAGFMLGAPLVLILHGGKKTAITSLVGIALMIPIFWSTSIHQTFLDHCVWRIQSLPSPSATNKDISPTLPITTAEITTTEITTTEITTTEITTTEITTTGPHSSESVQSISSGSSGTASNVPDRFLNQVPEGFMELNGRTEIWSNALGLFKESPIIGHGFHADRLLLAQHSHNSFVHVLLQTGVFGGVAFLAAFLLSLSHSIRIIKNLSQVSVEQKHIIIGSIGVLLFLLVRSITESTGAFFSIDWLLIAPLLLYLQVMNQLQGRENKQL